MAKQLVEKILEYLNSHEEVNSLELTDVFKEDHQKIVGAVKSLEAIGDLITAKPLSQKRWELTAEGKHVREHGSHEAAVYNAVSQEGIPQTDIMKCVPFAKVGFSKAMMVGWIELDKSSNTPIVRKKVPSITDITQLHLKDLGTVPEDAKVEYKKRKLIQEVTTKSVLLGKGPNFSTKIEKLEADLTADLLVNGAWKEKKFKPYNFSALGSTLEIGHLHPLLKVRSEFRKIFLEMGFTEMPTNNFVESSFWNFDALFQPQQHPARDAHDTFFISMTEMFESTFKGQFLSKEPRLSANFPSDYLEKVKKVHSQGGYGSQGYRYDWKIEEAQKNLFRTHTTAVSARMLYKLMQQGDFTPVKYFSIDRVFRNETLDATHLAEFHQVEGVVADYNLTLGDLIGILYEFFKKLGITQLEFKPAYNPYTEPSMEIFCYHNGLEKWIEIGNSGMFRPEMLLPMGLPENVNVIAWGLSLERPTMIKYGLNNIRDLVGPKVDMEMVYNNPVCRLDKTTRHAVGQIRKADQLSQKSPKKLENHNLILFCDPDHPVLFLLPLLTLHKAHFSVSVTTHVHSSVKNVSPELFSEFSKISHENRRGKGAELRLTVIFKRIGIDPSLVLPFGRDIRGQVNVARYFNRLLEDFGDESLRYESFGVLRSIKIDSQLDKIHEMLHGIGSVRRMSKFAVSDEISVMDLVLDAVEKNSKKSGGE